MIWVLIAAACLLLYESNKNSRCAEMFLTAQREQFAHRYTILSICEWIVALLLFVLVGELLRGV